MADIIFQVLLILNKMVYFTNLEGRITKMLRKASYPPGSKEDWKIINELKN